MITTEPDLKKKFTKGNTQKFTVSFAFCPHNDVITIQKHLRFALSVLRLIELSSYACMQENFKWVLGTCRLLG